MFVARIIADESQADYKAFSRKQDGARRYDAARHRTDERDVSSAALFEVPGTEDARTAIDAVKRNDRSQVKVLATYQTGNP